MKTRNLPPPGAPVERRIAGRAQDTHVIDPYKATHKLAEPTRCPSCAAVYHAGRWQWMGQPPAEADERLCTACQRIADKYPAGIVTLTGLFVDQHKAEILALVRNQEAAEKAEHPLNRIMAIEEPADDTLVITTTDIHLPRCIGEALHRAFHGDLKLHYDEASYFVRVDWER
jgi:hypothetical protein